MIQFPRQILEFLRRQIGGRQDLLLHSENVIGESRTVGARGRRDMGLAVPDQQDTHGHDRENIGCKLSLSLEADRD
jgi:hypothetical protein